METSKAMRLTIPEQIEAALKQEEPIEQIRKIAIQLNKEGVNKEDIIRDFTAFDNFLKGSGRDLDSDFLEEVIDMLTGYYVGRNLDF